MNKYLKETFFFDYSNPEIKAFADKIVPENDFADVKNHISSQKLIDSLKNDVFVMHGYAELYLDKHWVKATPVFDARLCEKNCC